MKKTFRGFTLIECVVAMAILGIASLIIAQIYAAVATRNKMNNLVNSSISNQMAFVEKYMDADTVPLPYSGTVTKDAPPPNYSSNKNNVIEIVRLDDSGAVPTDASDRATYSYPVDVYVLESRTRDNNSLTAAGGDSGYTEADYNLRYKYVVGHDIG